MKHQPGERFGSLVIMERRGNVKGSERVVCRCDCGTLKELGLPNLVSGATTDCADWARHPKRFATRHVTYHGAHQRVVRVRGKAREQACVWCGQLAEHWAFGHATADVRRDAHGKDAGKPYSINPTDYQAMCRRCHGRFDRKHRELTRGFPEGTISLLHFAAFVAHGGKVEGREEVEE